MELTKQQRNTWIGFGIGFIIVIAIILLLVLPKGTSRERSAEDRLNVEDKGTVTSAPNSYTEEPFTYTFEDLNWVFSKADEAGAGVPVTVLRAQLEGFTRESTDGSIKKFSPAYRLGVYQGECEEIPTLEYDKAMYEGTPLAYAACTTGEDKAEFVAFQEGKNILFMHRAIKVGETGGTFSQIFSLDLTTL